jgi:CDGSH-type Zn-finger protein/truncated hemoglobin YjbI/ferredoxin
MAEKHGESVAGLLGSAESLTATWSGLAATVVRPLREIAEAAATPERRSGESPEAELLELALALTRLCATDQRGSLLEACAGAQSLAADVLGQPGVEALAELAIATGPQGRVVVRTDGPYIVVGGTPPLADWLGQPVARPPIVALCRCGQSKRRPWCDGTHSEIGFSGAKLDTRVPDRVDAYPARQFEIRDNRGLCAHSGFCTDALPTVFRTGTEPFVAPAGGRADDILRAVAACPSGALRLARDSASPPDLAESRRDPGIEVSKDGPYRVTGGVELLADSGSAVPRSPGASSEHFSLCRCGHSANKPFCSGAHWYADFNDPLPDPDAEPTVFAWAGGYPALLRTTRVFYERHVPADELLAPLFAAMEPDHPERVAAWLSEVFGGPDLYTRRYGGYSRMIAQHLNKHLTEAQRARWVMLLARSADEAGLPSDPEFRAAFVSYLEWGSRLALENSQSGSQPPPGMPVPKWWWVCNATPSARPSSRPEAAAEAEPDLPEEPGADDPVSFARHIKGLFRTRDRASMRFVFDLWSAADVAEHAEAIIGRLRNGTMPCDGAWPPARIAVLQRWIDEGKQA